MKTNLDISKWLTLLAVPFMTACGHEELVDQDIHVDEEPSPYFELRIAMPEGVDSSSRSNPMGGEEGNGREQGVLNEDKIHDINVFFYIEEEGKGMDSDGKTNIIKQIYFNIDNPGDNLNSRLWQTEDEETGSDKDKEDYYPYFEKKYLVLKFKCTDSEMKQVEKTGLNFLVVANMGYMQEISTLGALRSYDFSTDRESAWSKKFDEFSKNASNMDYFLMSTAYNKSYSYYGQPTGTNKIEKSDKEYKGTTTLQRMYARLDLWYNETANAVKDGENVVNELKYSVNGADGNMVYLTNVLPVNVMKSPSFIFKKVTADESKVWSPTNNTVWDKASLDGVESFSWGGKETPTDLVQSVDGDLPTNYVIERHTNDKKAGGVTGDFDEWYGSSALAKVRENIAKDDNGKFSAYYHGSQKRGYYDPASDCDHISIISYANENTHPTDCFHSNYLTGMAFRAVYVPDKIYTDAALKVLDNAVQSFDGMKIYRYSPTAYAQEERRSLYFTDRDEAVKYSQAHTEDLAIITEDGSGFTALKHDGKWGFICYYNLWLRHYNNESGDPTENYPMEYATVRNNIYRVSVSFRGPGDPTPTMREPDTMKARIFVRKWNFREEDEIIYD